MDVTEQRHIDAMVAVLNGKPLDLLINNAGVLGPKDQGFGHTDSDAWSYTFKVNAIAPMKMLDAVESVTRMRSLIERADISYNGGFFGPQEEQILW